MNKIRCAIYTRFSSDLQREASNEDQRRRNREFAGQKGWEVLEEYVIADSAMSGQSLAPRTGLNKLLAVAKSGHCPFQYILVYDTSRLARNMREALQVYEELKFHNVYIYSVSQNIDGQEKSAGMSMAMHGIVDAQQVQSISEGAHRGIEGRFLEGFSTGGRRFGYRSSPVLNGKKDRYGNPEADGYVLKIESAEAQVVEEIFYLYAEKGMSARAIAATLNSRLKETGSPKPVKGGLWCQGSIWGSRKLMVGILNNPIYIGKLYWNRTVKKKNPNTGKKKVTMRMPEEWKCLEVPDLRIISDSLWEKAKARQKLITYRSGNNFVQAKRLYSTNLLTSLAKCGECGSTFGITSGGRDGKWVKYGCSTNWNKGDSVCGNNIRINRELLETRVCEFFGQELINPQMVKKIHSEFALGLSAYLNEYVKNGGSEINMEAQIVEQKGKIKNLTEAIAINAISNALNGALMEAETRLEELEQRVRLISVDSPFTVENLVFEEDVYNYLIEVAQNFGDPTTSKSALESIVSKITVNCVEQGTVHLTFDESHDKTTSYLLGLVQKRDSRIRSQTGTRFVPYTSNGWRLIITTNPATTPEVAGCRVYLTDRGIKDRRDKKKVT